MSNVMNTLYFSVIAAKLAVGGFIANEVGRIRRDERGMELISVILIILFVVVIAALLWIFLGDYIAELLQQIFDQTPTPSPEDIPIPTFGG
ncbi:MAG: hypothetical protein FWG65_11675 [Turicibacter sp.]|nr:hypothetical protein [Turicibacter sp.]